MEGEVRLKCNSQQKDVVAGSRTDSTLPSFATHQMKGKAFQIIFNKSFTEKESSLYWKQADISLVYKKAAISKSLTQR